MCFSNRALLWYAENEGVKGWAAQVQTSALVISRMTQHDFFNLYVAPGEGDGHGVE